MSLKTPSFWYTPRPTAAAQALRPLAALYGAGRAVHGWLRAARGSARAAHPVICVGGLVAGGSGKTPTALAIRALLGRGTFLARGYGGREAGPLRVDPARHSAGDVGDEAMLLAAAGPTIVARDRAAGARLVREGPIILDDGLQNPALHRDVRLAVIDGAAGLGNGLSLPAGPLREPLEAGLARADAFVLIGEDAHGLAARLPADAPVFCADLALEPPDGGPFLGFAGIGRPEKFRASLEAAGVALAGFAGFADHHPYTPAEIARLRARAAGASLLTTEKDAVRLPSGCGDVAVAPARLVFAEPGRVTQFLLEPPKNR